MASTYTWIAGSGLWSNAADWIGAASTHGAQVPGAADTATIASMAGSVAVVAGVGAAANLMLQNAVAVTGSFTLGALTTTGAFGALVDIAAGSVVSAGTASFQGTVQVGGAGATLTVGGAVLDGALEVVDGGSFEADSLFDVGPGDVIDIDATATAEIGGDGIATAGTLAIDADGLLSIADGTIAAPVFDLGTIETSGNLTLAGPVTGDGQIVLAGTSVTLDLVGAVGSGITVDFGDGGGDVVALSAAAVDATIVDFAPGDELFVHAAGVNGVRYTATGGGLGTVVLTANGVAVQTLTVAGDYTGEAFLLLPAIAASGAPPGVTATLVVATNGPVASPAPVSGSGTDPFAWSLTAGGSWDDAANWTVAGQDGPIPGAGNAVTLTVVGGDPFGSYDPIEIVSGIGVSASLAIDGPLALDGSFVTGALTVAPAPNSIAGVLALMAGTRLTAASAVIDTLLVDGASLAIAGTLTVGDGAGDTPSLAVIDAGRVNAGALAIAASVTLDPTAAIEVGGTGHAVAGAIVIDSGGRLSVTGNAAIGALVVDNGTIAIEDGGYVGSVVTLGTVSGAGTIAVGFADDLLLTGPIASSQVLAFTGADATIDLSASGFVTAHVTGLVVGDGFAVAAGVNRIVFRATSATAGTLQMLDTSGAAIQQLTVSGNLAGNSFVLESRLDANAAMPLGVPDMPTAEVTLAAGTLQAGTSPPPAPGTGDGESFTWAADGGSWGAAANWGTAEAPGSLDTVTFDYGTPQAGIVAGAGDAASVAVYVPVVLSGTFDFGALIVADGRLDVTAGATLDAGQAQGGYIGVTGAGALLDVAGLLAVGQGGYGAVLAISDGGQTRVGQLSLDTPTGESPLAVLVAIDSTAVLEVGTAGGAATGAMTVDAGEVVSGRSDWDIRAMLDNSGEIDVADTGLIEGAVAGSGTLVVEAYATLTLNGAVAASQTIAFAGPGATIITSAAIAARMVGFAAGDTIEIAGAMAETAGVAGWTAGANGTGRLAVGTVNYALAGDYTGAAFLTETLPTGVSAVVEAACFAEGTRIATEHGPVPIERLSAGTLVHTPWNQLLPIEWIGRRRVDCRTHPRRSDVWPVRVAAHAFGPGRPGRELFLSPDHAVHITDADGPDRLIPIRYLINDATIRQVEVDHVTYWHIELPRHDVVLAEGLACESYLDTGNRSAFEGGTVTSPDPDFAAAVWAEQACAELTLAGPALIAERVRLLARAGSLGHVATADPSLVVLADGWPLERVRSGFNLPKGTRMVTLRSRAAVPAHMHPDAVDHRRLGVAVTRLLLDGAPADPDRFRTGWHAPEPGWRWTDGAATLATGDASRLRLLLLPMMTYWGDVTPGSAPASRPRPAHPETHLPVRHHAARDGREARL